MLALFWARFGADGHCLGAIYTAQEKKGLLYTYGNGYKV